MSARPGLAPRLPADFDAGDRAARFDRPARPRPAAALSRKRSTRLGVWLVFTAGMAVAFLVQVVLRLLFG